MLDLEQGAVREIRLYPTIIYDFQARMAAPELAVGIADKMRSLCAELGTPSAWNSIGYVSRSR
jgi:poly-gamma-glutamate synthesis protein (capsule biosynthesis protein)